MVEARLWSPAASNSSRSIIGNVVCRAVVRIGFVGTGVIAWAHAIGLQAMIRAGVVDAAVVAVHDLDDERAAGFAAVNGADVVAERGRGARAL